MEYILKGFVIIMKYHKYGTRNDNLLFLQTIDFDNMALAVDNPNRNNIITLCSVGLVDILNQPSILRDNLFPLSQKYFDDFPANIDMNNMHVNNNHSACQANVPKVNECQLYNSCSQIIFHGWLISTLIP